MYIVTINTDKGKEYLVVDQEKDTFWWVATFKKATKFNIYREAKNAMRHCVPVHRISDATIYGY